MGIRLVVCGGGTGGHLFPGIAVADAVLAGIPESTVLFVGTGRRTDARVLDTRSFQKAVIRCSGLKGKTISAKLMSLLQLPFAVFASARLIRNFRPHLVLGVGGYVTGPVLLAAKMMGVATCIHEQNSVPGMANRKLGAIVDRIFLSIPGSEQYFDKVKCVLTGNPVRKELVARAAEKKNAGSQFTLLVLGGSLGAHRINMLMPVVMEELKKSCGESIQVIHQTGTADEQVVAGRYKELGINAEVSGFFHDMADIYQRADLAVARAGATSLAEMTVFNLPMILIPYPYAADNHQQKNGEYLVRNGAAIMFIEKEITEKKLAAAIRELVKDTKKREKMSRDSGAYARPLATEAILAECKKMISA